MTPGGGYGGARNDLTAATQRDQMLRTIGESLPILTRQPWPPLDQTSQFGIVCIQGRIQLESESGFRLSIPAGIESSIAQ